MAEKKSLHEFLKSYSGFRFLKGSLDGVDYTHFSTDSRRFEKGQMFIPLKGERFDGHQFIEQVLPMMPSAVVVEERWYQERGKQLAHDNVAIIGVNDTLDFLQQLAHWHREQFAIPVVGLTGSSGKTTTRQMMAHILGSQRIVVQSEGNQNNMIGVPFTLLRITPATQMAIVELGTNQIGEIEKLAELTQPTIALITNIGKAHLGYFGSEEVVFQEKIKLFQHLRPDGLIVLNNEDRFLRNYSSSHHRIVRVGLTPDVDVYGQVVNSDALGCTTFRLNDKVNVHLHIPGRHQVLNALMAAAVALQLGFSEETIAKALEIFRPVHQRMEYFEREGVLWINDAYNANPNSMRAAIDYLSGLHARRGRRIAVLGDMLELGEFAEEEHRAIWRYCQQKGLDFVLLYGPVWENVAQDVTAPSSGGTTFHWFPTHQEIADWLKEHLQQGDTVLVKGSRGMRMETVLEIYFRGEK